MTIGNIANQTPVYSMPDANPREEKVKEKPCGCSFKETYVKGENTQKAKDEVNQIRKSMNYYKEMDNKQGDLLKEKGEVLVTETSYHGKATMYLSFDTETGKPKTYNQKSELTGGKEISSSFSTKEEGGQVTEFYTSKFSTSEFKKIHPDEKTFHNEEIVQNPDGTLTSLTTSNKLASLCTKHREELFQS
jgi:hypothetical protein